jgi:hypothetical protein
MLTYADVCKVVPLSRESVPPWVNDTQYLCRVPGQQDCYDALTSEGCFSWCCSPCSILGAVVHPRFTVARIAASSLVQISQQQLRLVSSVRSSAPSCTLASLLPALRRRRWFRSSD